MKMPILHSAGLMKQSIMAQSISGVTLQLAQTYNTSNFLFKHFSPLLRELTIDTTQNYLSFCAFCPAKIRPANSSHKKNGKLHGTAGGVLHSRLAK